MGTVLSNWTIKMLFGIKLKGCEVSLEKQKAAGRYDGGMGRDITVEHFSLTLPRGSRHLFLVQFDTDVTSEQVEAWVKEHGYELALIDDLLAVGSHWSYRKLQWKFITLALGSSAVIEGERCVAGLDEDNSSRRGLRLHRWEGVWSEGCYRFLLVKKDVSLAA